MVDRTPLPAIDEAMRNRRMSRKALSRRVSSYAAMAARQANGTMEQVAKTVSSCSKPSIRRPANRQPAGPAALTIISKTSTTQAAR